MAVFENLNLLRTEEPDERQVHAERAAGLLLENFLAFARGDRESFSAYFVFDGGLHDMQREAFVRMLRTEFTDVSELPEGALVVTPDVTLVTSFNAEIDPDTQVAVPWDITYTGVRFQTDS